MVQRLQQPGLKIPDPRWVCATRSPGCLRASGEHHLRAGEQHCDNDGTRHHRHRDNDNDTDNDTDNDHGNHCQANPASDSHDG